MVTDETGEKMTQQALAKFESNPNARTWHLPAIVKILERLSHSEPQAGLSSVSVTQVPLISWVSAQNLCQSKRPPDNNDIEAWMLCPVEHSEQAYYLRVSGDSMRPEYAGGDIILVDPAVEAEHGDDVIVRLPNAAAVLKRLHITQEGKHLESLNPAWPDRISTWIDESIICGVVTGMVRPKARKR